MTSDQSSTEVPTIEVEGEVYNEEGNVVGFVSESTEDGFVVETLDEATVEDESEASRANEEDPGQEFGEGYIMWRCMECGEMGEIEDGIPEECPNCGAPKEAIAKARED